MAELSKDKFVIEGKTASDAEAIVRPSLTYWADAWRRLKKNKLAIISMVILVIIALFAIIAPIMSDYDYRTGDLLMTNEAPSSEHWFGTDELGRDLYVRVWKGTRISLFIGV
ncbi:ABC transporter permease, partial [Senegalia sp. (in: firmicutes)]